MPEHSFETPCPADRLWRAMKPNRSRNCTSVGFLAATLEDYLPSTIRKELTSGCLPNSKLWKLKQQTRRSGTKPGAPKRERSSLARGACRPAARPGKPMPPRERRKLHGSESCITVILSRLGDSPLGRVVVCPPRVNTNGRWSRFPPATRCPAPLPPATATQRNRPDCPPQVQVLFRFFCDAATRE